MRVIAHTEEEYAVLICQEIFNQYLLSIEDHHFFTFVLSGGETPKLIFNELIQVYKEKIDWSKVHFFWTDERCVSKSHEVSNYKLAFDFLLRYINPASINRIEGELLPEVAVENYETKIVELMGLKKETTGTFDLILLGMGLDGHVASIFPGEELKYSKNGLVGYITSIKNGYQRITLSMKAVNNSRITILMVSSKEKEDLLLNKGKDLPVGRVLNPHIFVLG